MEFKGLKKADREESSDISSEEEREKEMADLNILYIKRKSLHDDKNKGKIDLIKPVVKKRDTKFYREQLFPENKEQKAVAEKLLKRDEETA